MTAFQRSTFCLNVIQTAPRSLLDLAFLTFESRFCWINPRTCSDSSSEPDDTKHNFESSPSRGPEVNLVIWLGSWREEAPDAHSFTERESLLAEGKKSSHPCPQCQTNRLFGKWNKNVSKETVAAWWQSLFGEQLWTCLTKLPWEIPIFSTSGESWACWQIKTVWDDD